MLDMILIDIMSFPTLLVDLCSSKYVDGENFRFCKTNRNTSRLLSILGAWLANKLNLFMFTSLVTDIDFMLPRKFGGKTGHFSLRSSGTCIGSWSGTGREPGGEELGNEDGYRWSASASSCHLA